MRAPPVDPNPPSADELGHVEKYALYTALIMLIGGIIGWYAVADTVWFALHFGDSTQRINAAERLTDDGANGLDGLITLLRDADPDVRLAAVNAVAKLAPTRPDALTPLSRMLDDEHAKVRLSAVRALSSFAGSAPLAMDQIIDLLKQKSSSVRRAAASALPAYGAEAGRAAVPLIAAGITWRQNNPRASLADSPFQQVIDTLGTAIIPGLTAAADHNHRGIRILAAQQLVRLREHKDARTALQLLISCPYDDVRSLATRWAVNPAAPSMSELRTLILLLQDETTRIPAAEALAEAGSALKALRTIDEDTAKQLLPILLESDSVPGGIAAKLLAAMGPSAISALREGLASGTETARLRAVEALTYQGSVAVQALPELRGALQNHGIHLPIIRVLKAMGAPGIPILIDLTKFRDLEVRRAAIDAMGYIGIPAPDVMKTLANGLSLNVPMRRSCIAALLKLGPEGVSKLTQGLISNSVRLQLDVADALAKFEGDGSPALERLLALRRRKSVRLRALVVTALGKHGRDVDDVRDVLFQMVDDRSARVRAALASALGSWTGDQEALRAVQQLSRDRYAQVRKAAKTALSKALE